MSTEILSLYYRAFLPSFALYVRSPQYFNYLYNMVDRYTLPESVKVGKCKNCGIIFFKNNRSKRQFSFCSSSCSCKYHQRKIKETNLKLAYKNVDQKEFTEFYKNYNSYAMALIHEYDSEYWEDLKDTWQEKAIWWFRCLRNRYSTAKFLKKAIYYAFLNLRKKKKNEVFYDECGYKAQKYILGEVNEQY